MLTRLAHVCIGRGLARRAVAAVPDTFPISPTLTLADVSPHLRKVPEEAMRQKFELPSTASVAEAVKHLINQRITFAVVTDASLHGRVVGMFSERDYLRYAVRADASAFFSGKDATQEPVTRAMTTSERMLSARDETTVFTALAMVQHKIWRHLPILDANERLSSVLDIRDLLLELDGGRSDKVQDDVSAAQPGEHLRSVWHGKCVVDILRTKRRDKIVQGTSLELYLRTRAASHTISSVATIEAAAKQMARERLTFLIVVQEQARSSTPELFVPSPFERNRVVGLINERDFLRFGASHDDGLGAHARTPVSAPCALLVTFPQLSLLLFLPPVRTPCELIPRLPPLPHCAQISTIMTPLEKVEHVSITDTVSTCVDKLFARNVRHLPVIDGEHLFGVVSLRDILLPLLPEKHEATILAGAEHDQSSSIWRDPAA